jgi:5-methylcytosine-specific restriction protein A
MKHIPADAREGKCDECRRHAQRAKDQRRGSASARGYGSQWRRLRDQVIAAHPFCSNCRHRGSKDNPLSVDHIVQREHGGSDDPSNLRVLCLDCNKRRPRGRVVAPSLSAQAPTHDDPGWSIA